MPSVTSVTSMPSVTSPGASVTLSLVEIIELKWLLAGEGVHVHVERLQSDLDYARSTLQRAALCQQPNLRAAAARLRQRMGLATGEAAA